MLIIIKLICEQPEACRLHHNWHFILSPDVDEEKACEVLHDEIQKDQTTEDF